MLCQASQSDGFASVGAKTTFGANVTTILNPLSVTFVVPLVDQERWILTDSSE